MHHAILIFTRFQNPPSFQRAMWIDSEFQHQMKWIGLWYPEFDQKNTILHARRKMLDVRIYVKIDKK